MNDIIEINSVFENIFEISSIINKKLLYIGANKSRIALYEEFKNLKFNIEILEIFKSNVEYLKQNNYNVIEGDVQNIDNIINSKYGIIIWWHGPEHIEQINVPKTLEKIEKLTNLVILGGPLNDRIGQTEIDGNLHEIHRWLINEEYFKHLGYKTIIVKRPYFYCDHITAWKII